MLYIYIRNGDLSTNIYICSVRFYKFHCFTNPLFLWFTYLQAIAFAIMYFDFSLSVYYPLVIIVLNHFKFPSTICIISALFSFEFYKFYYVYWCSSSVTIYAQNSVWLLRRVQHTVCCLSIIQLMFI